LNAIERYYLDRALWHMQRAEQLFQKAARPDANLETLLELSITREREMRRCAAIGSQEAERPDAANIEPFPKPTIHELSKGRVTQP
jgi:hypothetical protein